MAPPTNRGVSNDRYHVTGVDHVGQRVRNREFPVVSHHCHQLHQAFEPLSRDGVAERVEPGWPLLQDLDQDLEEGGPCGGVGVVSETCDAWRWGRWRSRLNNCQADLEASGGNDATTHRCKEKVWNKSTNVIVNRTKNNSSVNNRVTMTSRDPCARKIFVALCCYNTASCRNETPLHADAVQEKSFSLADMVFLLSSGR